MRTDASGATLWSRNYGGVGDDAGQAILRAADGSLVPMSELVRVVRNDRERPVYRKDLLPAAVLCDGLSARPRVQARGSTLPCAATLPRAAMVGT